MDVEVILKRFDAPDEVREMSLGRFEVVHIGGLVVGRATYQPGWRWSEHVGSPSPILIRVGGVRESSARLLVRRGLPQLI
jgi:hypothetical protein